MDKNEIKERILKNKELEMMYSNEDMAEVYKEGAYKDISNVYFQGRDLNKAIKLNSAQNLIDKEKLISYLKKLPQEFLLELEEIIFWESKKDFYQVIVEETNQRVCNLIEENEVGKKITMDRVLLINIHRIETEAYGIMQENIYLGEGECNFSKILNGEIILTLLHELGHLLTDSFILNAKEKNELLNANSIKDLEENEEEVVEEFAQNYFNDNPRFILKKGEDNYADSNS